ncbi:MAG: ATP-binding protein, partial [Leptothrix ochracea]
MSSQVPVKATVPPSAAAYGEASIRVLKGLEPVKQRPGMYTRTDNPLHIVQEVIDNAADEALAGFGSRIAVNLHLDGSISVEDDGRGIPFGLHPEEGVPVIEIVYTRLHAGGKFDKGSGGAYSFSGGLHGVGVSVTNALATRLAVTVWREKQV